MLLSQGLKTLYARSYKNKHDMNRRTSQEPEGVDENNLRISHPDMQYTASYYQMLLPCSLKHAWFYNASVCNVNRVCFTLNAT